ncbi:helix-turn-helix domain-containing protein [Sporosarcina trichiuri]|uniref:helix-turn-helix domain-containing protein n=1 Tax=Sporosarcina trichiuri TaxID=3056445 RepID=UPI0025B47E27|nr:helix-turn-helix transcriptional regulator [Sporosarcina sp. 0.2-SM1T-5]WJY26475.1 helix-turn-helix transcriptional regulator [Sporosarcina sp. 0.2-SM1T-5]
MLHISTIIHRERQKHGITQETLAAHCQVSKASVSKWEKGLSYPDITLLPKIAAYFNLTVDELLGYEQTLSKQAIQTLYIGYSKRFAHEPFADVYQDVLEEVRHGYRDAGLLLQMSVLMLNHFILTENGPAVLTTINTWLDRIRTLSEDVWVLRQANSLQAAVASMQGDPETTLRLLDGVIRPSIGDEALLATAYEQLGQTDEAMRALQVMMYQNLLQLVGAAPLYLRLSADDPTVSAETLRRTEGLIGLYDLEKLHPNVCLQFHAGTAQLAAIHGDRPQMYAYLSKFVRVCTKYLFPIDLHGDTYFNRLDSWLEELDLGTNALRSDRLVKQSLFEIFDAPFFAPYRDDEEMKDLLTELRFGLEGIQ